MRALWLAALVAGCGITGPFLSPRCGDGVVQESLQESCDDGNALDGDGCSAACVLEFCGDGIPNNGEPCDDGNDINNDTCRNSCIVPVCGDGVLDLAEACDDGNNADGDACSALCLAEICGNGVLTPNEDCDDGNALDGDGCDANCTPTACGNGIQTSGEECDDGNSTNDDGCDNDCQRSEVVALALGDQHTCALTVSGAVFCWGDNSFGQLGLGDNTGSNAIIGDDETPRDAARVPLEVPARKITAGLNHTCALLNDETVRCWGANGRGQLGLGNTATLDTLGDNEPITTVPPLDFGPARIPQEISAGENHTCALFQNGEGLCWGAGEVGQQFALLGQPLRPEDLGDNETLDTLPSIALGAAVEFTAGGVHNCARLLGNEVRCWGAFAANGVLGYGNTNNLGDDESPSSGGPVNIGGTVIQLSLGAFHSCALLANGGVRCWGDAGLGRLGYGNANNLGDNEVPSSAGDLLLGQPVLQLDAGKTFTCAVLADGGVRCWGDNAKGQLGLNSTNNLGDNEVPSSAAPIVLGGSAFHVAAGTSHACALLDGEVVRCWGDNAKGQLGLGIAPNLLDALGDDESPTAQAPVPLFE